MRKIERTPEKSNRALGYAMLGVGAAALVGAVTALVVKSRKDDRHFRECLAEALDEEFESAYSGDDVALRVIVVEPNESEDCNCDCNCCCCCECDCGCDCDYDCDCDCDCEHECGPERDCEECKTEHGPECACEACEPEHNADCACNECETEQPPTEEPTSVAKPEKPVRKSKKQPE